MVKPFTSDESDELIACDDDEFERAMLAALEQDRELARSQISEIKQQPEHPAWSHICEIMIEAGQHDEEGETLADDAEILLTLDPAEVFVWCVEDRGTVLIRRSKNLDSETLYENLSGHFAAGGVWDGERWETAPDTIALLSLVRSRLDGLK